MKSRTLIALTLGALAMGSVGISRGAEPSADEVVGRYLAARGGAEAWRKVESLEMTGVSLGRE